MDLFVENVEIVHCKKSPYDIYIGRFPPSSNRWEFGNPFSTKDGYTRDDAVDNFLFWLIHGNDQGNVNATKERREWILSQIPFLGGKTLGCWCNYPRERCHGEVLRNLYLDWVKNNT